MNLQAQFEEDSKKTVITDDDLAKITKLAKLQLAKQKEIEKQAEYLKQLQEDLRVISQDQLPDAMLAIGMEEFKLKTGEKVLIKAMLQASISRRNTPAAHKWLRDNGFADIIKNNIVVNLTKGEDAKALQILKLLSKDKDLDLSQKETIHAGTLKAFIKEQREKGMVFPDCFTIFELNTAQVK